jgi:pimeloyl-ACP methyl ester carboxylesterase
MATYVLVHGAWSGAHGFRKVRALLQSAGHQVFTPSLTGIGERVHLVSPQVDLSTHVADVVNQVLYEDLDEIVLLGFSYGGMVVAGALAQARSSTSRAGCATSSSSTPSCPLMATRSSA